ncbi:hypothetical protein CYLTODRAFT_421312 [Cylindrobasidium torrendii FP15055 ss-10]|uniref:Uncharacterized protein n=1 Tax=Cylindrobasidium torrendii FP15055 ss-10 TaxID=1314674 RepID=A0A0D7BF68_9AGAR|nr:hypothetical protein CYLTODRAFT_421312 [Cylindrobasidium torrendii FP15055 ss-10]
MGYQQTERCHTTRPVSSALAHHSDSRKSLTRSRMMYWNRGKARKVGHCESTYILREWKMSQQKDGPEYKEWLKKATEAWPEFSRLQDKVDQVQGAVDQVKGELGGKGSDEN